MKKMSLKAMVATLALGATAILPMNLHAVTPYLAIAGSSALFNTLAISAWGGASPVCGTNHWTYKSSGVSGGGSFVAIHDSRSSSIADEPGTIWISWNSSATVVCAFIQVDSTVGVRAAFARVSSGPAASFELDSALSGAAGQNKVPNTTADVALPAAVYSSVNGALINVAAADIRPEDAKFATTRALTALGGSMSNTVMTQVKGLGYYNSSTPSIGYPIESSQSTTTANPVDFALFGTDPISSATATSYFKAYPIGAGPVIVFVNTSNSASYHLGDTTLTNITSPVLTRFLDGTFSRTRDLFATTGVSDYPVKVFLREPLSGMMNTLEYNVPATWSEYSTQEKGVQGGAASGSNTSNPLSLAGASTGSGRYRVVGTGEMISTVIKSANADSLGYAFWGYGNFSGVTGTAIARYLTVDGVDPLYSSASANPTAPGVFPVVSGSTYPAIPFTNIINGSYPIWTTFRLVGTAEASQSAVQALVSAAQTNAATYYDFVSAASLNVFHSHFFTSSIGGSNGHVYDSTDAVYYPEQGGDVGGWVFPIQADYDFIADNVAAGNGVKELVNIHK